jgi:8-oxo-dGTP pyrophosphatase MutT (NUDIX family)
MESRLFTQSGRNLTFQHQDAVFNYRVAAIFRLDSHVLLHRVITDDFWALPGGRPHHFESAPEALRREMREEFGETVEVARLSAVIEVVFLPVHEIDLCFEATLPPDSRLRDLTVEHAGNEENLPLIFKWFPIAALQNERILPRPVTTAITNRAEGCDYWFDDERQSPNDA